MPLAMIDARPGIRMSASSFFGELKRRQIYRGGVMYVVAGWVIVQVSTTLFPIFNIPGWAIRLVVVALMLGFPLALVALWMFESHGARSAKPVADTSQAAQPPMTERRRSGDRSGEAIAQLMQHERAERQRANEELIAALDRLHGVQHGEHQQTAPEATYAAASTPIAAPAPAKSKHPRLGTIFIALFTFLLAAWLLWILVAPSASVEPRVDTGKLTHEYVMPAYRQAEQVGAMLLKPLLRKLGLHVAPERAFSALMMVVALLVLRKLYRSMVRSRRSRHGRD